MKKKILVFVMMIFAGIILFSSGVTSSAAASASFYSKVRAYGFNISEDYEPIYMSDFKELEKSYYEKDKLNHTTKVVQVLLRNKYDPSIWCFIYRVCTSPLQVRDNGFMGLGSNGDDWYTRKIKTTIQFRDSSYEIINFAPQNKPSTTSGTIGVGLDSNGPSISASVDYNHSELSIVSNTKTALYKYETIYNYSSSIYNTSSYLKGDIYAYGMVMFKHEGVVWIDVEHEIGYFGYWWYGYNESSNACMVRFKNTY